MRCNLKPLALPLLVLLAQGVGATDPPPGPKNELKELRAKTRLLLIGTYKTSGGNGSAAIFPHPDHHGDWLIARAENGFTCTMRVDPRDPYKLVMVDPGRFNPEHWAAIHLAPDGVLVSWMGPGGSHQTDWASLRK